jgi:acetylornithine deacetylase/succinyl-diaminopimelate desuccinylase-like protein
MLQAALSYLRDHEAQILDELIEWVRIPSVSADPAYSETVAEAGQWAANALAAAGLKRVGLLPTGGNPVAYGEWLEAAGQPTVLIYGHYDVQPPDPLDKWVSPPFEPQVRGGRVYGRGISDDKAPVLLAIKACEAWLATGGAIPINVKFLIEGEEESGSTNLERFVAEHTEMLAADFVMSADGAMWRIDEPSLTVASRGLAALEFTVTCAAKDLHSGRHGGAVNNACQVAAELVASLKDSDGKVLVPGFYDDVLPLADDERAAIAALPFDEARYLSEVGAPAAAGEPGYTLLERNWTRPTLDVNGLWGGYEGPGGKTVIPSEAHVKLSCRLVPKQDPADIAHKIAWHLESHLPPSARLEIHGAESGALPYAIPVGHPALQAAKRVLADVYHVEPLIVRMGATIPVAESFMRYLHAHTVFFSFSVVDEDYHAPNEFFRLSRIHEGLEATARYLLELRK